MKRLAIIGAGSSGLVTLKHAVDALPDWEIVCYEKGNTTIGCWGDPYPGFVSTSTKFTTQFACYRKWDSESPVEGRARKADFFLGDEYGRYLMDFVEHFALQKHIQLSTSVERITRTTNGWKLSLKGQEELFDKVIICTGLAEKPRPMDAPIPVLQSLEGLPSNKKIVVFGGGESAADIAHRLANPELGNTVYLSLKTGIRVSPRYHPIRGVPSDFLRNRLMLSIDQGIRNAIGQKFVEARIKHREKFERLFGRKDGEDKRDQSIQNKRKEWDAKLTAAAKDHLFNVFHTKSDGFLDDVAEGRIQIVGPPCDPAWTTFKSFDGEDEMKVSLDVACPMIGFRAAIEDLSKGELKVSDFHLGSLHRDYDDIFLVGFARPIIGNIPSISEMQAKLVVSILAGHTKRPDDIMERYLAERKMVQRDFPLLNTETMLPVEMFPYCDGVARMMNTTPTLKRVGSLSRWWKIMQSPASTTHYVDRDFDPEFIDALKVHSPPVITGLLLLIKLFDLPYRMICRSSSRGLAGLIC